LVEIRGSDQSIVGSTTIRYTIVNQVTTELSFSGISEVVLEVRNTLLIPNYKVFIKESLSSAIIYEYPPAGITVIPIQVGTTNITIAVPPTASSQLRFIDDLEYYAELVYDIQSNLFSETPTTTYSKQTITSISVDPDNNRKLYVVVSGGSGIPFTNITATTSDTSGSRSAVTLAANNINAVTRNTITLPDNWLTDGSTITVTGSYSNSAFTSIKTLVFNQNIEIK
jgi:hypothetical protein